MFGPSNVGGTVIDLAQVHVQFERWNDTPSKETVRHHHVESLHIFKLDFIFKLEALFITENS